MGAWHSSGRLRPGRWPAARDERTAWFAGPDHRAFELDAAGPEAGALLLHGVRVPTLIVQGKADRVVRAQDTRALARRFSRPVQLHELEAGHLLLDSTAPGW